MDTRIYEYFIEIARESSLSRAAENLYISQPALSQRLKQLEEKGEHPDFDAILSEVNARDHQDMTRAVDPLRKAADAVEVDSSDLNFEETVQAILRLVEAVNG